MTFVQLLGWTYLAMAALCLVASGVAGLAGSHLWSVPAWPQLLAAAASFLAATGFCWVLQRLDG